MTADDLPRPEELGFRRIARFGTRSMLASPGRKWMIGDHGFRIAYIFDEDDAARALIDSLEPAVYFWIIAGEQWPVYVGKAGSGMRKRCREHEAGFQGDSASRAREATLAPDGFGGDGPAGLAHARRIRMLWADPTGRRELDVWVRLSDRAELFGHQSSLASSEEEALIAIYSPPWNREYQAVSKRRAL